MAAVRKVLNLNLPSNAAFVTVTYRTTNGKEMEYFSNMPISELPDPFICDMCDFQHWDCDIGDEPNECGGPHKADLSKFDDVLNRKE